MNQKQQTFQVTVLSMAPHIKEVHNYLEEFDLQTAKIMTLSNHCRVYRDKIRGTNYFYAPKQNRSKQPQTQSSVAQRNRFKQFYTFLFQLNVNEDTNQGFWLRTQRKRDENRLETDSPYLVLNKDPVKDSKSPKAEEQPVDQESRQGYALKIGDIIKFGNIQYTLIEMKVNDKIQRDRGILGQVYKIVSPQEQKIVAVNKQKKSKKIKKQKTCKRKVKSLRQSVSVEPIEQNDEQVSEQSQSQEYSLHNQNPLDSNARQQEPKEQTKPERFCRICLQTQQTVEDPFISPCLCKGSCSYIHLQCLTHWVTSNIQVDTTNSAKTYFLYKASCQICKHPFPHTFQSGKKRSALVDFGDPRAKSYIILYSKQQQQQSRQKSCFVVINGENDSVSSIGRTRQSDIKIVDFSVSREHAEIYFKQNKFYLRDTNSRYGTLVKLRDNTKFSSQIIRVQSGRSLYKIKPIKQANLSTQDCDWKQLV